MGCGTSLPSTSTPSPSPHPSLSFNKPARETSNSFAENYIIKLSRPLPKRTITHDILYLIDIFSRNNPLDLFFCERLFNRHKSWNILKVSLSLREDKWNLVHYACRFDNVLMLEYLLKKAYFLGGISLYK